MWILGFLEPTSDLMEESHLHLVEILSPFIPFYDRAIIQLEYASRVATPIAMTLCSIWMTVGFAVLFKNPVAALLWGVLFGVLTGALATIVLTPLVLPFSSVLRKRQEKP